MNNNHHFESRIRYVNETIAKLQELMDELFETEKRAIEAGSGEFTEENYDEGSFLWQHFPRRYNSLLRTTQIEELDPSDPCRQLAVFLSILYRKLHPQGLLFSGLSATHHPSLDNQVRFCISGEISLDKLQSIFEHYPEYDWLSDES